MDRIERKHIFMALVDLLFNAMSSIPIESWKIILNSLIENIGNRKKGARFYNLVNKENAGGTINNGDSGF